MEDQEVFDSLNQISGEIAQCKALYENETLRRARSQGNKLYGLALSEDVIYKYAFPTSEHLFSFAAVEALLKSETVKTIVFPEVFHSIARVIHVSELALGDPFFRDVTGKQHDHHGDSDGSIQSRLEENLRIYYEKLWTRWTSLQRLQKLASHLRVRGDAWMKLKPQLSDTFEDDIERRCDSLFRELYYRRTGNRTHQSSVNRARSFVDSRVIASVVVAAENKVNIPLITDSSLCHRVFKDAISDAESQHSDLLLRPFRALVVLSLERAETGDLHRLNTLASTLLSDIKKVSEFDYPSKLPAYPLSVRRAEVGDLHRSIPKKYREILDITCRLAQVSSLLYTTWSPPATLLPKALDLQGLATAALDLSESIMKLIETIETESGIPTVGGPLEASKRRTEGLRHRCGVGQDILKELANGASNLVINRLIIVERGAQMSEYNFRQIGSNLTAIVDSFKSTLDADGSNKEAVGKLRELVESVLASSLSEEAKQHAVEATTAVAEGVEKDGKVHGTLTLLWNGVRETIKTVPAAVLAWEALSKLWL